MGHRQATRRRVRQVHQVELAVRDQAALTMEICKRLG